MNTLVEYPLPEWLSISFLSVIPLPFLLILLFIKNLQGKTSNGFVIYAVGLFFLLYLTYLGFASLSDWFNVVSLPPRVLLLSTFPYGFLLFGFAMNTPTFKNMIEHATLENLVKLHIFRIIGVFFILLAFYDALPKPFALIAGFGDIITAISSVFVAKAINNKKPYAQKLVTYWNIFGTIDILFTAIAANILTKISIDTGAMGVDTLAMFPFCIIPAFAPPTILLMHWVIFKKMKTNHGS
jgi:hypothetical protein